MMNKQAIEAAQLALGHFDKEANAKVAPPPRLHGHNTARQFCDHPPTAATLDTHNQLQLRGGPLTGPVSMHARGQSLTARCMLADDAPTAGHQHRGGGRRDFLPDR